MYFKHLKSISLHNATTGDLIGKAWNIYKMSFREVLLYSFLSNIFFVIAFIIFTIPSTFVSEQSRYLKEFSSYCIYSTVMFVIAFIFLGFFNFGIIKIFYNKITGENTSAKVTLKYLQKNTIKLFLMCLLIITLLFSFIAVDIVFATIISLPLMYGMTFITNSVNNIALAISNIFVYLLLFLLSFQYLLFGLIGIVFVFEGENFKNCMKKYLLLLKKHLFVVINFFIVLTVIWFVLDIFFNLPCLAYQYYIQIVFKTGITTNLSVWELLMINCWNFAVNTILWPFITASQFVFYYSQKIKTEGLDFEIILKHSQLNLA